MVKVWIEEVMTRIEKVGSIKWFVSHSNSSNKAPIGSQREKRSDYKKLFILRSNIGHRMEQLQERKASVDYFNKRKVK